MNISFQALRTFVATVETKSMSKAAIQLGISRSGVSHIIKDLETILGFPLFVRQTQGLKLTKEGRFFFEQIAGHVRAIENAYGRVLQEGRLRRDSLFTFSTAHTFYRLFFLSLIESGPGLEGYSFRLLSRSFKETEDAVLSDEAQFGATILPVGDPDAFYILPLGDIECLFVTSKLFYEDRNRLRPDPTAPWSAREVLALPLVTHPMGSVTVQGAIDYFRATFGLSFRSTIEVHQLDLAMELAQKGLGAAFTFTDMMSFYPDLMPIPTDFSLPKRKMVLIARNRDLSNSLRTAMEKLAERFRANRSAQ